MSDRKLDRAIALADRSYAVTRVALSQAAEASACSGSVKRHEKLCDTFRAFDKNVKDFQRIVTKYFQEEKKR